ncbi:MerR family transcriptional regulator [Pseudonocardia kunmingensis]|uniref:MerR family transcriptional regulator n=1 Tax=Pseudonocardia kunmingensis TaxID=630975 RepID=A0A543DVZ3_9PSEU|nr:MerR family transcriptional regulator [Pseudonocardia kunmingensis]TQM13493.1 MerR family transcriptional regulator [Pseudonocardia kunmingensis]
MTATVDAALDRLKRQDAAVPDQGATLTIAEMAERTGVSAHTLRYYERIGLLSVARDGAGYRVYTAADYARVVFLNRMRMTGMSIRGLQRYVALVEEGETSVPERREMMLAHRDAIRAQIQELVFALETVEFKIAAYGGHPEP